MFSDAARSVSMHELSIAMSLLDAAAEEARRLGASRITALHLRIGARAGVVAEALRFSFDLAAEDTMAAGARLDIEGTAGTELEFVAMEVVDDAAANR